MGVGTVERDMRWSVPAEPLVIYTYLDYRKFLRDWFDTRKAANPRYSHRLFARKAGQRSPSTLLLVMDGRRNLTSRTAAAFANAMGLDDEETQFFLLLVQLDQADLPAERSEALAGIMSTRRFREGRRLDADALSYFSNWYFPAIHELAHRQDFRADAAWIAQTLCPSITEQRAAQALEALLDLGLLAPDEAGVPRPTDACVVTPHEVAGDVVNHYHLGMLERARESIYGVPMDERHILGITTMIPQSLVPALKKRLNEVQKELLSTCEEEPKERVYQISIAFFPLSERAEEGS